MKQIAIFIGLKLAELCALAAVITGLSLLGQWVERNSPWAMQSFDSWAAFGMNLFEGMGAVLIYVFLPLLVGGVLVACVHHIIKKNWQWAKKLARKE